MAKTPNCHRRHHVAQLALPLQITDICKLAPIVPDLIAINDSGQPAGDSFGDAEVGFHTRAARLDGNACRGSVTDSDRRRSSERTWSRCGNDADPDIPTEPRGDNSRKNGSLSGQATHIIGAHATAGHGEAHTYLLICGTNHETIHPSRFYAR